MPLIGSGSISDICLLIPGSVPLDPLLSASIEDGQDFTQSFPDSATFSAISSISQTLLKNLETDWSVYFAGHKSYNFVDYEISLVYL